MKRKLIVVALLVVVCLCVLVVKGVSQPPSPPSASPMSPFDSPAPSAGPPPVAVPPPPPKRAFNVVQPPQQEWTFEQLVEALKGVRARQKELQAQEADLLAKMAKKVEEKRQDLSKSEATLKQLREDASRPKNQPHPRTATFDPPVAQPIPAGQEPPTPVPGP